MPKIIDNIRDNAVSQAREVLVSEGYGSLTMRGIAARCGVAVGTMYNYFESKEHLTGCVVVEDWNNCYTAMLFSVGEAADLYGGLRTLYAQMGEFTESHRYLDEIDRRKVSGRSAYTGRHEVLLGQTEELVGLLTVRFGVHPEEPVRRVIAEMIIHLNSLRYEYELAEPAFRKLIG